MAILTVYADSINEGQCRSCDAPIVWAKLVTSGRRMPFNVPLAVVRQDAAYVDVDAAVSPSHFATCPQSKEWRRR